MSMYVSSCRSAVCILLFFLGISELSIYVNIHVAIDNPAEHGRCVIARMFDPTVIVAHRELVLEESRTRTKSHSMQAVGSGVRVSTTGSDQQCPALGFRIIEHRVQHNYCHLDYPFRVSQSLGHSEFTSAY